MILIQVILSFCCASVALSRSYSHNFESALIGPEFCESGQVVWCQNFTTAIECNAVKHCIDSVWLTQKPSSINVGSCDFCESEIEQIRQGIGSNTTREVLQELLENVCDLTFITELFRQKQCEKFIDQYVDNYFNELLDLLKSDIDAASICHILGFCSDVQTPFVPPEEGVVIRFQNIILHLPADTFNVHESTNLLGTEKCTWGPAYWCTNITSSKQCNSTSHCIRKVWPKQQYDEDNDSVCKVCKDMVQQARDQLQSNETQAELREVFEGSCKLIPIKEVRKECIQLADEFVPELTAMLVSEMNPTAICTVAGLCNSARIDSLLSAESNAAGAVVDSCTNCTAAFTAVERYLLHAPQSDVLDKLLRLCDELSSYSDACAYVVISNFNSIYNALSKDLHPLRVCHLSGVCASQYDRHSAIGYVALESKVNSMLATADDNLPCDLCKNVVKHIKGALTDNTTAEDFRTLLKGFCRLTGSFQKDCSDIVDYDFEKIYQFLTQELCPCEVCRALKLCPKENMVTDENMNLIYSRVAAPAVEENTSVAIAPPRQQPRKAVVECRICRMVIELVQKEMNNPVYAHHIEKILEKVCALAPRGDQKKCDIFVEKYANVLIEMLANETDAGIVCAMLDLCVNNSLVPQANANELCPICQYVLHFIQEELEKPEEQRKIEDVVRRVCAIVPKSEQGECNSFVNEYAALIIGVLSEEIDPSLVCPALKVCPSLLSPRDSCSQCQRLMNDMVARLGDDHSSERNVVNALRTLVPAKRNNMTLTAVQLKVDHRDDIVDAMSADFSAQELCAFLHFCSAEMISADDAAELATDDISDDAVEPMRSASNVALDSMANSPSCELCELVVQLYEDELTSNATEKEIVDELQKFCDKITNPELRSNCAYFVQKYVPEVVKLVKHDVKPSDVCSLVKLCPPPHAASELGIKNDDDGCELCEAVVGSLERLGSDAGVAEKSMISLMQLCSAFVGQKEQTECLKIVSVVGPQLETVLSNASGWFMCSKMRVCPYGSHLTYKKVCSNQSDWCVDVKRAVLCDKLVFCRKNVWKSDKPSL